MDGMDFPYFHQKSLDARTPPYEGRTPASP